jgi:UDP-N-acetylmuramyl pentapeptide phosphotransferase/UDP-N-acetylglucosamine-1-phosphate transferase
MLYYSWVFAHFVAAAVLTTAALPFVMGLLKESGAGVLNYRQREVIGKAGITIGVIWVLLIAVAMTLSVLADSLSLPVPSGYIIDAKIALPLTLLIMAATFFGFIDDSLGTREFSGFKGHIGALFKGRLTTGALKAIGIPLVAVISAAPFSLGIFELIGNALLIALTVNTLNLFDLRPGRALKVYIPLQLAILIFGNPALLTSSASLTGIAVALIGPDLKEKIMLGDSGANVLGAALGFCIVVGCDWNVKIPLTIALIVLQQLTEHISISKVVEKTAFLRMLDDAGRSKAENKQL